MKKLFTLFILFIILFSCKKDEEQPQQDSFTATHGGIYISNEGNFQSGNSSITYYDPSDKTLVQDLFKVVNNQSLGDICQSMNLINGKLFLIINNSGKIEVCDPYSLIKEKTITGFTSPRYIVSVNATKAYVSDAYSNHISIINLISNSISGTISINGWTEQMLLNNNKVFVTNMLSSYLYIVNPDNDILEDSLLITLGANSILSDTDGKIWVLCGGDYLHTYKGFLYKIDPLTKQIEQNISFQQEEYPSRLCSNSSGDSIYFLNTGVYKMSITDNALPSTPLISSSLNSFYGLGIDKIKNEIYVSDAIDYIQKGKVFRYKADGTPIDNFLVGIIPGDFIMIP